MKVKLLNKITPSPPKKVVSKVLGRVMSVKLENKDVMMTVMSVVMPHKLVVRLERKRDSGVG